MTDLTTPLQFYIKHAADVGALWAEGERPDGVDPLEWETFEEVLEELKSDADALLHRLAEPLETGLAAGFVVTGKRPYKLRESWDYYRQVKPNGRGNRGPVGYAGIQILDEPGGCVFLVVYLTAMPSGKPDAPANVADCCPDALKATLTDRLVVACLQLKCETQEEAVVKTVADALPGVLTVLESLSAPPTGTA